MFINSSMARRDKITLMLYLIASTKIWAQNVKCFTSLYLKMAKSNFVALLFMSFEKHENGIKLTSFCRLTWSISI